MPTYSPESGKPSSHGCCRVGSEAIKASPWETAVSHHGAQVQAGRWARRERTGRPGAGSGRCSR